MASLPGPSTSIPPPIMSPLRLMPKGGPKVSCVTPIVEPCLMTVTKGRYPHNSDTLPQRLLSLFARQTGGIHVCATATLYCGDLLLVYTYPTQSTCLLSFFFSASLTRPVFAASLRLPCFWPRRLHRCRASCICFSHQPPLFQVETPITNADSSR